MEKNGEKNTNRKDFGGIPAFWWIVWGIGIILAFVSFSYAAHVMRPLNFDGANFIHGFLSSRGFVCDGRFSRYIDFIPQLPAWVGFKVLGEAHLPLVRSILFYSYAWLPLFGLLASIWLCFLYKKTGLVVGPLLSFGFISIPTSSFAFSTMLATLAIFWPIYLIQMYGKRTRKESYALYFFTFLFAYSHETTIALILFLLLLALIKKYYTQAALLFFVAITYMQRLLNVPQELKGDFYERVGIARIDGRFLLAATLILLMLFLLVSRLIPSKTQKSITLLGGFFIALLLGILTYKHPLYVVGQFHSTATIFLCMVVALTVILDEDVHTTFFHRFLNPIHPWMKNFLYGITLYALLFGVFGDLLYSQRWNEAMGKLKNYVAINGAGKKCLEVDRKFFQENLKGSGIADFCLSHLWATMQPDAVVNEFIWINPEMSQIQGKENICAHLHDNPGSIETKFYGPFFRLDGKGFTYRFLER